MIFKPDIIIYKLRFVGLYRILLALKIRVTVLLFVESVNPSAK